MVAGRVTEIITSAENTKLQGSKVRHHVDLKLVSQEQIKIITKRQRQTLVAVTKLKKNVSKRQQRRLQLSPSTTKVKKETPALNVRVSVKRKAASSLCRTAAPVTKEARLRRGNSIRLLRARPLLETTANTTAITYQPRRVRVLIAVLKQYVRHLTVRKSEKPTASLIAEVRKTVAELEYDLLRLGRQRVNRTSRPVPA